MPQPEVEARGRSVASVARAIALLEALAGSDAGLGVNELARRIGVNASTASRLLVTLQEGGLVARDRGGGPYRLGLRLVSLADRVLDQLDVRALARPLLARLVAETGETATLSVPDERAAVTVDFVPSPSSVVSMARVGRPSILHATAAGKVMLAFGAARRELGAGRAAAGAARSDEPRLSAYTERTITDPAALAAELEQVGRLGWAQAAGEREPDLAALAAPVFGRRGELAAILGLQGPLARLGVDTRAALSKPLLAAARELGAALGAELADRLDWPS